MLDIGWTELLVIGIVALIVVGPKDLPVMFHNLGKFTARLRTMAREFTRAMDDAAQASGAKDMARDLRTMSNPGAAGKRAFTKAAGFDPDDPFGEAEDDAQAKPATNTAAKPTTETADAAGGTSDTKHGPNTARLAEERAAAAKARREEAAARANERSASFKGFDTAGGGDGETAPSRSAPSRSAPSRTAAPAPGASAPAPAADAPADASPAEDARADLDKA